ncbi:serine hydrolase-like protein [Dysidea avara]|uniref:serine hydrolase-like protein n=1 Tax=Dysidea avara TaxID=196820 RepID=UPI0033201E48
MLFISRCWTSRVVCRYRAFINTSSNGRMASDVNSKKDGDTGSDCTPVEVSIDVPWGRICGKAWGSSNGKPVLALHGWLDNSGTFDKLLPLLSPDLYIVAIDFPGHGLSSPRPAGAYYHFINMVADVKYVVDALGWKRFSFLSHSMGAGVSTLFAASLPEYVEKLVLLEGIAPLAVDAKELPSRMGKALNNLKKFQDKATKVYPSQEACIARLMEGNNDLTEESARVLSERGTAPVENGYVFTRDLRLKSSSMLYFSFEVVVSFLKALQCPLFVVRAEISVFPKELMDMLVHAAKGNIVTVAGNHHVHLNNAAVVAPIVNRELLGPS